MLLGVEGLLGVGVQTQFEADVVDSIFEVVLVVSSVVILSILLFSSVELEGVV